MRIGYHFWGFLGPGIADTADDGRSHRRTLIDALAAAGHEVVLLQIHRDLAEAGDDLGGAYTFDVGHPGLDALVLEWRRPWRGRNTTPCGWPGHTCDLHRQLDLLARYTVAEHVPTVVWDRGLHLPEDDPLRELANVAVAEPALRPRAGASRLLLPVPDAAWDAVDPEALASRPRKLSLVLVGDQEARAEAFERFFVPAAGRHGHRVAGRWADMSRWPRVDFVDRLPFSQTLELWADALATLVLPSRHEAAAGLVSQRIPEALAAGCVPIVPSELMDAEVLTPAALCADDGVDVVGILDHLVAIAGTSAHAALLADCLQRRELFRVDRQVAALEGLLEAATTSSRR